MTSNEASRWRLPRGFPIRLQSWDDETVAYHDGSGDTHLLGPVEAAAIRALQRRPANVEGLMQEVAAELNLPADAVLRAHLDALVYEFHKVGLIEPDVV